MPAFSTMPDFSTKAEAFVSNAAMAATVSRETKSGRLRKIARAFTPAI